MDVLYVRIVKFIDKYILTLICIVFGLFVVLFSSVSRIKPTKDPKNILLIKVWALGDTVNFLPLVDSLKKKFPLAKIWVLAKHRNKSVFEASRLIDKIILFEKGNYWKFIRNFRKFDIVIDGEPYLAISALFALYLGRFRLGFGNQLRSKIYHKTVKFTRKHHMVNTCLRFAGLLGADIETEQLIRLKSSNRAKKIVLAKIKEQNIDNKRHNLVGLFLDAAESATFNRMWPVERFAELANRIIAKFPSSRIVLPVPKGPISKNIKKILGLVKHKIYVFPGNLDESFYLISLCKVFISNDTGPMHIAAAQGVRTIGLFGPNTPKVWAPYGKDNISIYHKLKCSPCIRNDTGKMPDCKIGVKCIKLITVDEVFEAFKSLIK